MLTLRRVLIFAALWLAFECAISWLATCDPTSQNAAKYSGEEYHCTLFSGPVISIMRFAFESLFHFLHVYEKQLVAGFTIILAIFTGTLWWSTRRLWDATVKAAKAQSDETRILQRAYLSVEPGGIRQTTDGTIKCIPVIEICNVGNLPAREIEWSIQFAFDFDDRRPLEKLAVTKKPEGENVLPPGGKMLQGGKELIDVGPGGNELRKQPRLYLYVWGVVHYDDGFEVKRRSTFFCHRYNCINLRNVNRDESAPNAVRLDAPVRIARKYARYHRKGNSAT